MPGVVEVSNPSPFPPYYTKDADHVMKVYLRIHAVFPVIYVLVVEAWVMFSIAINEDMLKLM